MKLFKKYTEFIGVFALMAAILVGSIASQNKTAFAATVVVSQSGNGNINSNNPHITPSPSISNTGGNVVVTTGNGAHSESNFTPNGTNGTVKIHEASNHDDNLPTEANDPKVCTFHIHGFNFDANQANTWAIDQQQPTGNAEDVETGNYTASSQGEWASGVISLPNGKYKLEVEGVQGAGKFKVFWVNCDSATPTPTYTPTPTIPVGGNGQCIDTDVKGSLSYIGNHMSANPVNGSFDNIATNQNCSDDLYVHIFGSNDYPESANWFDNQTHIETQTLTIPQGQTNYPVQITVPDADFCWYQVDVTRTSVVKNPPFYSGTEMVDYVFVQDTNNNCGQTTITPTVTPTPTCTGTCIVVDCPNAANCEVIIGSTPTPTPAATATPTPSNTGGSNSSSESVQSSKAENNPSKEVLGASTLAPTGNTGAVGANIGIAAGISLIAASFLRKSKKA